MPLPDKSKLKKSTQKALDTTLVGVPFQFVDNTESLNFVIRHDIAPGNIRATKQYDITGELARGGMGAVYRAIDPALNREVAVKILLAKHFDDAEVYQQFVDEARITSYLQHPGVANIFDIGFCEDGQPFHSMKLIHGTTLYDILNSDGQEPVSLSKLLSVFSSVCQTISFAHSKGIVHLDLKTSNIMVGDFGEVYLMDWGLAKVANPGLVTQLKLSPKRLINSSKIRRRGKVQNIIQGSLPYMSPEMACGEDASWLSDIFGLGAILFEILTGHPLYVANGKAEIHALASKGPARESLDELKKCRVDRQLTRLVMRCLANNPAHRPQTGNEIVVELANFTESALQQLESDMGRFFELSLDCFCICNFDGFFKRINSNFSRILGYPSSALSSRHFINFVHPDDRESTMEQMAVLTNGEPVVRFRNRYQKVDGNYVEFEWTAKSIPEEQIVFAVARLLT